MSQRTKFQIAVAVAVFLFAWLVWPTPWFYRSQGRDLYRINRITQNVSVLTDKGQWVSLDSLP